jgi:hypothetical protein
MKTTEPEVTCRLCDLEVPRPQARAEGWHRDRDGWVCTSHQPIDWPWAGQLAHDASQELQEAMGKLFRLDVSALGHIDEALAILGELREATAKLREPPAPARVA